MSDRCTGRAQPRTTPLHGRYDHITTSARHITLAPPLSRWIHLVRKDDASCHLGGHAGAWHSSEPVVRVCGPLFLARRVGQPASHEGAWWHAGEHGIRSSSADKGGSHLVRSADVPNSFTPAAARAPLQAAPTTTTACRIRTRCSRRCYSGRRCRRVSESAAPAGSTSTRKR
jgi:hypothetical protein